MNKFILSIAISLITFSPAIAVEEVSKEMSLQAKEIAYQATKSEDQFQAMQGYINGLDKRIAELERKVAGMQHQITVLHAKKADKEELKATRDQIARILGVLKKQQSGLRNGLTEAVGAIMSQANKP